MTRLTPATTCAISLLAVGLLPGQPVVGATPQQRATGILQASGVKGGLVVHLGCNEGKLTASLRGSDSYIVHGLAADWQGVDAARKQIRALGGYGEVSVSTFDGERLPYSENVVNLLVAEAMGKVAPGEILRVLVPNGVACICCGISGRPLLRDFRRQ